MSTSAAPLPAVRAAASALVDYAGLFPPAQLDMPGAVAEYARARSGEHAWMLGRFICPSSRLEELRAAIPAGEAPFAVSAILDDWDAGLERVEALELKVTPGTLDAVAAKIASAGAAALPIYAEWPRESTWRRDLDRMMGAVRRHAMGAKVRCGGLEAQAFPQPEELAAFLCAAGRHGVSYKATAGLHHPVRHLDARTGFVMHGFLNLLFASVFAQQGASEDELCECLRCEDSGQFRFDAGGLEWNARTASIAQIEQTRRAGFVAYGSCSFAEPVEDLQRLGLL